MADIRQLGISDIELVEMLKNCRRSDICDHFKISERTLERIISENNLSRSNYGPKKLDQQTISDIRFLYATKEYTQKKLADRFNISQSMVCKIVNNQAHQKPIKFSGTANIRLGLKHDN